MPCRKGVTPYAYLAGLQLQEGLHGTAPADTPSNHQMHAVLVRPRVSGCDGGFGDVTHVARDHKHEIVLQHLTQERGAKSLKNNNRGNLTRLCGRNEFSSHLMSGEVAEARNKVTVHQSVCIGTHMMHNQQYRRYGTTKSRAYLPLGPQGLV